MKHIASLSGKEKAEIWIAGFSFGAFIAIKLLEKYLENIHKTILLGIPFSLFDISLMQKINFDGLVIHGEMDEITNIDILKENIEKSLAYQNKKLVVSILEKNDHFFSNNLENLKNTINKYIKNVK
jgi:alpha/beta superfamily hydrolase